MHSLPDLLRSLHRRGRLLPLLREAAVEELCVHAARDAGLSVLDAELQAAIDDFRRRHDLHSADATSAWLARQQLTLDDLEATLEHDLFVEKFKDHLAARSRDDHFARHRSGYDRARLCQVAVEREDLARELLHQFHDDGEDFACLARMHSVDLSALAGGSLGLRMRRELSPDVAAAVFAATAGAVVGPLASGGRFHLLLVEEILPAELDGPTAAVIREELFNAWQAEKLRRINFSLPFSGPPHAS